MNFFKKIKIIHKLIIIMMIYSLGLSIVVFSSFHTLNKTGIGGELYQKIDRGQTHLYHLNKLESNLNRIRAELLTMLIEKDEIQRKILWEKILNDDREIKIIFSILLSEEVSSETRKNLLNAYQTYHQFRETRDNLLIPSIFKNEISTIEKLSTGIQKGRYGNFMKDMQLAFYAEEKNVESLITNAKKIQKKYLLIISISLASALIIVIFFGVLIIKSINQPIKILTQSAHKIIKGNLKTRVEINSENEIGLLAKAFNEMLDSLERSYHDLEQFAHIASHDLQEPLRKIRIYSDLVMKSSKNLDQKTIDDIIKIENASKRMSELISSLLKFSLAIENNEPFNNIKLNLVLKEVINDLEIMINEYNAKIEVNPLPIIDGNKILFYQLFQNLIINAMKYHQKGKKPKIVIDYRQIDSNNIKITVTDNGIGIDERYWKKIFMPFQRLNKVSDYVGNGIGLTLCKKIVEKHRGKIYLKSKLNQGSQFIIELPIN